ncbi:hypothetical protein HG531_010839 [Fusarium graminearum]|nr:hypothetical protein HG531_010839 [Fusarium graminearum]
MEPKIPGLLMEKLPPSISSMTTHLLGSSSNRALKLNNAEGLGVSQHRGNKTLGRGNGNANIDVIVVCDDLLLSVDLSVDLGNLLGSYGGGLCEGTHVTQTHPVLLGDLLLVLGSPCDQVGHVDFLDGGEGGAGVLGLLETTGDGLLTTRSPRLGAPELCAGAADLDSLDAGLDSAGFEGLGALGFFLLGLLLGWLLLSSLALLSRTSILAGHDTRKILSDDNGIALLSKVFSDSTGLARVDKNVDLVSLDASNLLILLDRLADLLGQAGQCSFGDGLSHGRHGDNIGAIEEARVAEQATLGVDGAALAEGCAVGEGDSRGGDSR